MTTTPERETPEQIVEKVMREAGMPWAAETPGDIVAALRAAGLLVGAPTVEQIERAAQAIFEEERNLANEPWPIWDELGEPTPTFDPRDPYRDLARAALTAAAGVAPQEPIERWRRLRSCVENWPDAATGEHNPACCRFPKSCSATLYDPELISEDDLEPAPSPDREKLIAEARLLAQRDWCLSVPDVAKEVLNACADALAAAPVVDEAKLAEALRGGER